MRRQPLAILAIVSLVAVSCGTPSPSGSLGVSPGATTEPGSRTLTIALNTDIQTFDPFHSSNQESNEFHYNVFERFYQLGTTPGEGEVMQYDSTTILPRGIEETIIAPDGMSMELHVREGMTFPNSGNPVTADDIVWLFDTSKADPGAIPYGAMQFVHMESWEKTGPMTVEVQFSEPLNESLYFPYFRDASIAILDSRALAEHFTPDDPLGNSFRETNGYELSSNFWKVASYTPGSQIVLDYNPDYWGEKPYYDRVVLQVVVNEANRALLLRQGEVDIAEGLGQDSIQSLQDASNVKILSVPTRNQMLMGLHQSVPPFDNQLLRQALAYAIPYEDIVSEIFKGNAQVSTGAIPNLGAGNDPSTYPYVYDPDKARDLLAEAGSPDGFDFTCHYQDGFATQEQLMVFLQGQLQAVGINMELQKDTAANFANVLGDLQTQCWARELLWYVDDPGYQGSYFGASYSALGSWFGDKLSSPELDAIIAQMQARTDSPEDEEAKAAAVAEYQRYINDFVPVIWLGDLNFQVAMSTSVCGYQQQPDNYMYYAGFEAC